MRYASPRQGSERRPAIKFATRDIGSLAKPFGFVALYDFGSRALEAILDLGRQMLAKAMG
ncbi:MAG: hypothetical protein KBA15_06720 [Spirochaetes bacterium]|nr:hypothetical protein [Spirochaetota bacterium]